MDRQGSRYEKSRFQDECSCEQRLSGKARLHRQWSVVFFKRTGG